VLVGVTGNIGSGKSTLCKFLELEGFPVFYADIIGKKALYRVKEKLLETFGSEIFNEKGEIDTKKISSIVFSSPKKLKTLTEITHPLIKEEILRIRDEFSDEVVFVEAAVLIEAGWMDICDKIVLVFAYRGQRILRASRKFGLRETLRRDSLQKPYSEKFKYADYLICNTGDLIHLKEQAISLLKELQ
jgi:dephospho-CoA kinase